MAAAPLLGDVLSDAAFATAAIGRVFAHRLREWFGTSYRSLYPVLCVVAWPVLAYRLFTALRLYVRFDLPAMTVLATQAIVALAIVVLLLSTLW